MYNFFANPFPVIDLGEITLREIKDSDAEDYYRYMNDQEVATFLTENNRPDTFAKALNDVRYWASLFPSKRSIFWGIALKENNQLIGTAGFNIISFQHLRGELSYDLDRNFWGKGLMLKSVNSILKFADHELGLIRVQATVEVRNERSIKVLERCGFNQEGILRKFEIIDQTPRNYYMYGRV